MPEPPNEVFRAHIALDDCRGRQKSFKQSYSKAAFPASEIVRNITFRSGSPSAKFMFYERIGSQAALDGRLASSGASSPNF
jgi:hypothetical protein